MAIELLEGIKDESDLELIIDMEFSFFKNPSGHKSVADARKLIRHLLGYPDNSLVVAYDINDPVGFSIYGPPFLEDELFRGAALQSNIRYDDNCNSVSVIAVLPEYRKKGVGTDLLQKVIEGSKENGTSQLYATCWKGKLGESYYLFKKLGFKELGTIGGVYCDGTSGIVVVKEI